MQSLPNYRPKRPTELTDNSVEAGIAVNVRSGIGQSLYVAIDTENGKGTAKERGGLRARAVRGQIEQRRAWAFDATSCSPPTSVEMPGN